MATDNTYFTSYGQHQQQHGRRKRNTYQQHDNLHQFLECELALVRTAKMKQRIAFLEPSNHRQHTGPWWLSESVDALNY